MKKSFILIGVMLILGIVAAAGLLHYRAEERRLEQSEATNKELERTAPRFMLLLPDKEFAGYGTAAMAGAAAAIGSINAKGGLEGKQIRLESASSPDDVPGNPTTFVAVLDSRSILSNEPSFSWSQKLGVPVFYLLDGPCRTSRTGSTVISPHAWSMGLTWDTTVEPLLAYLNERFNRPEEDFGVLFLGGAGETNDALVKYARENSESLGFKTVDVLRYDTRIADYYSILRNILTDGPNVLFMVNPGTAGNSLIEQAAKLGMSKELVISGVSTFDIELTSSLGQAINQIMTAGRYGAGVETEANNTFVSEMAKLGAKPSAVAAAAYTAVHMMVNARTKAGGSDLEKISRALSGMEFQAPTGLVRLNPVNHILEQNLFILEGKDGNMQIIERIGTAVHPRLEGCGVTP